MARRIRSFPAETAGELDEEMFAFNYELASNHS
jgi:hypothetical protein